MRLLIFVSSTASGGAERMSITLANELSRQVTIRLVVGRPDVLSGAIDPMVDVVELGVARMRRAVRPLRRLMRDWAPSVVFSPQPDAGVPLAIAWRLAGRPGALVLRESNYRSGSARMPYWDLVARGLGWAYRQAAVVVAPAHAVATDLAARYTLPAGRIRILHNPVDIARVRRQGGLTTGAQVLHSENLPAIVAVGRLVPQKGFDLLLRAFAAARTHAAARDMSLTILGEGSERARLERLVDELGLASVVRLPGVMPNPYAVMARAKLFVLSSRWEGFPNALVEAMALGVPPVAYRCPGGAGEIIEHGKSGLLCLPESVSDLAAALTRVVEENDLRRTLAAGAAARARVFDASEVSSQYLRLFQSLIGTR